MGQRSNQRALTAIRVLHTAIWALVMLAIVYILYCSIFHIENALLALSIVLVVGEGIVLVVSGGICPLTRLARRYSDDPDPGFDIYLPGWVLRRHKLILGGLFALGLLLNLIRNVRL